MISEFDLHEPKVKFEWWEFIVEGVLTGLLRGFLASFGIAFCVFYFSNLPNKNFVIPLLCIGMTLGMILDTWRSYNIQKQNQAAYEQYNENYERFFSQIRKLTELSIEDLTSVAKLLDVPTEHNQNGYVWAIQAYVLHLKKPVGLYLYEDRLVEVSSSGERINALSDLDITSNGKVLEVWSKSDKQMYYYVNFETGKDPLKNNLLFANSFHKVTLA